jgi:hypothetical protein
MARADAKVLLIGLAFVACLALATCATLPIIKVSFRSTSTAIHINISYKSFFQSHK